MRKTGKVPEVKMREKNHDGSNYSSRRVSANFSSSGHPVRPPRKSKGSHYEQFSFSGSTSTADNRASSIKQSNVRSNRSHSSHVPDKYHFGNPVTVRKVHAPPADTNLHRSYSSVQNLQKVLKPTYMSSENLSKEKNVKKEKRSSISSRHRSGDAYQAKNKATDLNSNSRSEKKEPVKHERRSYSSKPETQPIPIYSQTGQVHSTPPSKIIYTRDTPAWAQDTKYRTKIVINGD